MGAGHLAIHEIKHTNKTVNYFTLVEDIIRIFYGCGKEYFQKVGDLCRPGKSRFDAINSRKVVFFNFEFGKRTKVL
jgi:hypothetical protein